MAFVFTIAQLVIPSDAIGAPTYVVPDWPRGLIYFVNDAGVRTYTTTFQTQSPVRSVTLTGIAIYSLPGLDPITGDLLAIGSFPGHASGNAMPVFRINPITGLAGNWDGTGSSLGHYPTGYWVPEQVVGAECNGVSYAVVKEDAFDGSVAVARMTTPADHAGYEAVNIVTNNRSNRAIMCLASSGASGGSVYLIDAPASPPSFRVYGLAIAPGAETYNPATWPTTNPHISSRTIGPIAASAVNPAWTTVNPTGITYNPADGHVIASLSGASHILAKINTTSGAVMWTAAVDVAAASLADYSTAGAALAFITPAGQWVSVDRATGAVTTVALAGVAGPDNQRLMGAAASLLLLRTTYNGSAAGAPVPAAGTPASFTGWALLQYAAPPDPNFPLSPEVRYVLLPSAELQFADANGHPYAAGTLEMLIPGTSTPKNTWSDPDGAALNANPIVLDAAGRCVVFGDGAYRTILRDAAHNLVWDKPSFTYVSVAMMPVVGAPTIAEAVRLLGIQDGINSAVAAEAAIRAAADAAELAGRADGDTFLSEQLIAENARAVAAEAALQAQIDGLPGPTSVDVLLRRGSATSGALGAVTIAFATPFPLYCMTFGLDTSTFDTTGGFELVGEVLTASGIHFTFTFGDGTTPRVGVAFNYYATGY